MLYAAERKIEVNGYQNLVPIFETPVTNNILKTAFRQDVYKIHRNNISVKVYTPSFESLYINGSVKATVDYTGSPAVTDILVSGSGKFRKK